MSARVVVFRMPALLAGLPGLKVAPLLIVTVPLLPTTPVPLTVPALAVSDLKVLVVLSINRTCAPTKTAPC